MHHRLIISKLKKNSFSITLINPQFKSDKFDDIDIHILPNLFRWLPWRMVAGFFITIKLLMLVIKNDALFLCGYDPMILAPSILIGRSLARSIFHEFTEFPEAGMSQSIYSKISKTLFEKFFIKNFDGSIVISTTLFNYVQKLSPSTEVFVMPAIALSHKDIYLSNKLKSDFFVNKDGFSFVYAGSFWEKKDGVISLINSFSRISKKWPKSYLYMAGYGTQKHYDAIYETINSLFLKNRVILLGELPQYQIPNLLKSADALVLCRPSSRQAEGGFPTKLAEYLSTGNPVIVTDTSDISLYLKDNFSAFIVPPDDIEAFARAMDKVLSDIYHAKKVGLEGQITFEQVFDADVAVSKLSKWLRDRF